MNEREELEIRGDGDGLTRRDVFVKGGLLAAGASVLGAPAATAATRRADASLTFAVITHGAGDAFWVVCKKGAVQAGKDIGITIVYSESRNNPQRQAQLVDSARAQKVKGIATSVPNASALKDPLKRAEKAGIPVVTLNSGVNDFKRLGAITHVGQTETIAGNGAGDRLRKAGGKHLLVVIHEQGNIGLEQRYSGAKSGFKGKVTRIQVAGVTDLATTTNQIRTKLSADKSIDAVLSLNPQVGIAAQQAIEGARSKAKLATFDLSGDVIKAIQRGKMLFAVDQQQYMQGYLPVVFLYLYDINLNTAGGGKPVLTGPGFVDKSNAARVAALAKKATR
jgi:simple sugar transport system substrate-binding protein